MPTPDERYVHDVSSHPVDALATARSLVEAVMAENVVTTHTARLCVICSETATTTAAQIPVCTVHYQEYADEARAGGPRPFYDLLQQHRWHPAPPRIPTMRRPWPDYLGPSTVDPLPFDPAEDRRLEARRLFAVLIERAEQAMRRHGVAAGVVADVLDDLRGEAV